jgi:taurine-pyruvate aminotransferase
MRPITRRSLGNRASDAFRQEAVMAQARHAGELLRASMRDRLRGNPLVSAVWGAGMVVALDMADDGVSPGSAGFLLRLQAECQDRRLLINYTGSTVILVPPLNISDRDIEFLVQTVGEAVDELAAAQACHHLGFRYGD